jgi:polycystin 2
MFMAIINLSYSKVKDKLSKSQPEFMLSDFFKLNYGRMVDKLSMRKSRILDIEELLQSEEVSSKDELEYNHWRKELMVIFY